eukprot:COSAG01_NODE_2092_length_8449_cov_36.532934_1_plen_48_part_00
MGPQRRALQLQEAGAMRYALAMHRRPVEDSSCDACWDSLLFRLHRLH